MPFHCHIVLFLVSCVALATAFGGVRVRQAGGVNWAGRLGFYPVYKPRCERLSQESSSVKVVSVSRKEKNSVVGGYVKGG